MEPGIFFHMRQLFTYIPEEKIYNLYNLHVNTYAPNYTKTFMLEICHCIYTEYNSISAALPFLFFTMPSVRRYSTHTQVCGQ
jgi:hypothetical protein